MALLSVPTGDETLREQLSLESDDALVARLSEIDPEGAAAYQFEKSPLRYSGT